MRVEITTAGESETEALARALGERVPDGTVIGLVGELGAGKTCFVRGLAAGIGVDPREVASPTFLYLVEYAGGRLPLRHADLYRFEDLTPAAAAEGSRSIGLDEALTSPGVTAVEWWNRYVGPVPAQLLVVEFEVKTIDVRALTLDFSGVALAPLARSLS
jgi:tRNA threonylcarbamoyladenosine biosynthesis protein TsaE